jgi:hypothetical protein
MPTDKPLPDTDDDIIDLTDLVEEGRKKGPSGDDGPVDMSFEQELEDLFGDDAPAKAAKPAFQADDDLIDLTGLDLADANAGKPASDDEVVDLSDLVLDEVHAEGSPQPAAEVPSPAASEDVIDLSGLGVEEPVASAAPVDDALADLFEEPVQAPVAAASADESMDLAGLELEATEHEPPVAPMPAAADEAMDISDMDLPGLQPAATSPGDAMADLLGELPESPVAVASEADAALDVTELSDLLAFEETPKAVEPPATAVEPAASVAAAAAPAPGPTVGAIDLGALDHLIDAAKGPAPEPEPETTAAGTTDALVARLEALESAAAELSDRLDALPPVPDEEDLATVLAARLEEVLTSRFESLLATQAPPPDLDDLKTELLAEIEAGKTDHDSLLADLQNALAPQFDSLRQGLPVTEGLVQQTELAAAMEGLHEALARLEALTQGRQTQFEDFAATVETRLAELRRELPEPDAFVSPKALTEALDALRESLGDDMAASLDDRLSAVTEAARQTAREEVQSLGEALAGRLDALETDRIEPDALAERVRESLCGDVAASLDDRLSAVTEAAQQTAREEVQSLGEALAPSLETAARAEKTAADALNRLDAKLDREDFDTALAALRTEMTAEMERAVPRAAAAVIREEIAALAKEFL